MEPSAQDDHCGLAQAASGMDHEHTLQVHLFQALCQAIEQDGDWRPILEQAAAFSRAHFLSEELLTRLYQYEDFDDHVADHERMLTWLDEFPGQLAERAARLRAATELTALFLRHVGGRDRQLHDYLNHL